MMDDFYIGYDTPVPKAARSRVFGFAALGIATAVGLALVFVAVQQPFAAAFFAFGHPTSFEGTITLSPNPALEAQGHRILLVAQGKHGAGAFVGPFGGRRVRLRGSLIERDGRRMVEVLPGTIEPIGDGAPPPPSTGDWMNVALDGEILDGKCYLGVMNPGEGTVHRECARVCLRGGVPALFVANTRDKGRVLFELVGPGGSSIGARVWPLAGRPVSVAGRARFDPASAQWTLEADPAAIQPIGD